ncbi:Uncharacterized protein dnm_013040 [Desulfonema magnum]|uniref:Uncharacterized protein n=1 Tax=Desulfonema magnum TaxID=45655 RepID=A0A975BHH2_9BACT|nr:Uncharacterized protein dnm_013040 [Desulfonema magnum]
MCLCLEKTRLKNLTYKNHLNFAESLITPYDQIHADFVALVMEIF